MKIRHILKSGKTVDTVAGIVLHHEDFPELYALLNGGVERGR